MRTKSRTSAPRHPLRFGRRIAAPLVAVAASLVVAASGVWAPAEALPKWGNHCISPFGDLNELYGISQQIVNRFCPEVDSGERWTAPGPPWLVNTSFEIVPEDFVPAGATPLEDFVAKFVALKYVIDPGTTQQRTLVYPTGPRLWTGIIEDFPAVSPAPLSRVRPLSVGEHTVETYWVMSAMHCDGFAAVIEENCLGPGEVFYLSVQFEVTPGAPQSNR
jgi:hypothetical protein